MKKMISIPVPKVCLRCGGVPTIRAHIIPKAFGRLIKARSSHNINITSHKIKETQLGIYDDGILCARCDNTLGNQYDEYGVSLCREFNTMCAKINEISYTINGADCDIVSRFVLSILWRASVTKRAEFESVNLGVYEHMVMDIIFNGVSLATFPEYQLLISRFRSEKISAELMYSLPIRARFGGHNCYNFALAGFRIAAIIDRQQLPDSFRPFIVNKNSAMKGLFAKLEDTNEFRGLLEMVRRH